MPIVAACHISCSVVGFVEKIAFFLLPRPNHAISVSIVGDVARSLVEVRVEHPNVTIFNEKTHLNFQTFDTNFFLRVFLSVDP